ncbi:uncharacterized protein [Amphiura filiformis]|uniref:uncharacterized protein n=1 Tax=Amphiura filiformis TaxID=82378 RepID=UPI003B2126AF
MVFLPGSLESSPMNLVNPWPKSSINHTLKVQYHPSGRAVEGPIAKTERATWAELQQISKTDHFAKVAEGFMAKWLLEDLEKSIDPNQYGNRKGVSTTHYLVKLMDTLIMNSDKPGHLSSVVITYFSKAFDLGNHNVLINKFISLGIRPSVVTWIASFLDGREQSIRYRGQNSDWVKLKGGVPQGTHWPIWFCHRS